MLVFLHGQGESSPSPIANVALQGPPQHAGRHPNSLPFAVLSPQKPMASQFFDEDVASQILVAIRQHLAKQPIDARRVYLTGLSQGGIGTWGLASDPKYVGTPTPFSDVRAFGSPESTPVFSSMPSHLRKPYLRLQRILGNPWRSWNRTSSIKGPILAIPRRLGSIPFSATVLTRSSRAR